MCTLEYDERPAFWSQTHPKARKPHRCAVCRKTITAGERYLRESGKWDGDVFSDACCLDCEVDRNAFAEAHDRMFPFVGGFRDELINCISEGEPESERTWKPMLARIERRAAA